jgi:hypothetical protein
MLFIICLKRGNGLCVAGHEPFIMISFNLHFNIVFWLSSEPAGGALASRFEEHTVPTAGAATLHCNNYGLVPA